MIETKQAKLAAVALIFNEDKTKLLGVSRGKVDVGESMSEGVIREVKEETGLSVKSSAPIFLREDGEFVAAVYLVTNYEGEVSTKESGVVAWITFEDLKQGAFSEYNTKLEQHLKFLNII